MATFHASGARDSLADVRTEEKWKSELRKADALMASARPPRPLGASFSSFAQAVENIAASALSALPESDIPTMSEVARLCALRGFKTFADLDGADFAEVQLYSQRPAVSALLRRLLAAAAEVPEKKEL